MYLRVTTSKEQFQLSRYFRSIMTLVKLVNTLTLSLLLLSQIIPKEVRGEWQESLEAMESSLSAAVGGRPISSLVVTLETPDSILVICTAGQSESSTIIAS